MLTIRSRRSALTAITLALTLVACSFNNGFVRDVTIDGGDRAVPVGDPITLTVTVTRGGAATDHVTWSSSHEAIASVDAGGAVLALTEGATDLTATSVSDPSKSDMITLTVTEAVSVASVVIEGGDRRIILGDPLTLTATVLTSGGADPSVTWSSSDEGVATMAADGTVLGLGDGTTDLTATSVSDPTRWDTITLTIDPVGSPRWTDQFGTPSTDTVVAVATDAHGNLYVTGYVTGALEGVYAGGTDAFLRAYDPNGNHRWTRQFGTIGSDVARGVATDTNGNIFVAGYVTGTLGDTNFGDQDAFLRAYDPNGDHLWTRQFGSTALDRAQGVAIDENGTIFVAGYTRGDLAASNAGAQDAFVRAYDANGDHLWTNQFGTTADDAATAVTTTSDGHVLVAGSTGGDLDGDIRTGNQDAFLRAYDTDGTLIWARLFGAPQVGSVFQSETGANGIATGANGNIYIAGYATEALGSVHAGGYDGFLRAYDAGGNHLWTDQFGTDARIGDIAAGVATNANGTIYIAGHTGGSLDGPHSGGGSDLILRAYEPDGHLLWGLQFGTAGSDIAFGIATGTNDRVYIAGVTDGILGQSSAGGQDAFVRAYDQ